MTNPEKVYQNNIRKGFCDDCIEKQVGVDRHEVNTIASTLALFSKEFTRSSTTCPQQCSSRDKLVTQAI